MVLDVVQKLRGFYDNSPNGKGRGRKGRKSAGGAIVEEESQDVGNEDEAKKGKEKGCEQEGQRRGSSPDRAMSQTLPSFKGMRQTLSCAPVLTEEPQC